MDLFHFDSDEDVFCVYSQYIDDLMLTDDSAVAFFVINRH